MSRGRRNGAGRKRARGKKLASAHVLHRIFIGTATKGAAAADTGSYQSYALADFPSSDIVSLYQQYRIKAFEVTYTLFSQPNNNSNFPQLYIAPQEYNNQLGVPSSFDEVVQYKGVITHQFGPGPNQTFKHRYVPRVFLDATQGTSTGSLVLQSPWVSTFTAALRHMSHVEWITNYNAGVDNSHTIRRTVKAIIECKDTR